MSKYRGVLIVDHYSGLITRVCIAMHFPTTSLELQHRLTAHYTPLHTVRALTINLSRRSWKIANILKDAAMHNVRLHYIWIVQLNRSSKLCTVFPRLLLCLNKRWIIHTYVCFLHTYCSHTHKLISSRGKFLAAILSSRLLDQTGAVKKNRHGIVEHIVQSGAVKRFYNKVITIAWFLSETTERNERRF